MTHLFQTSTLLLQTFSGRILYSWRKNFWGWNLPLKIKPFSWLFVENKLNTRDLLQRKGWIGPSICTLCRREEESTSHLFVSCSFTCCLWARITDILHLDSTWDNPTLLECYIRWNGTRPSLRTLPPFICWYVWIERNNFIFNNVLPSISAVICKSLGGAFTRWNNLHKKQKIQKHRIKTVISKRLPTGWFDGAVHSNGLNCGTGGLIRVSKNSCYCWTLNCDLGTNTKAELLGAWASILLATRLNLSDFQLLGDSKIVIDWLNSKGKLQVSSLLAWMDRTHGFQNFLGSAHFFTLREKTIS